MFAVSFASGRSRTQLVEPPARAAVELADVERAAAADEDPARLEVVGAEVHERAYRPLGPDPAGDLRLVDPVLERDDEAVGREPRRDRRERGVRVLRLDREQHRVQLAGELLGRHGLRCDGERLDRPFDREPARVDRGDVVGIGVAEEHRVAVAREARADRPADRTSADDDVVGHATCSNVATISFSARSRIRRSARSAAAPSPIRTASCSVSCCMIEISAYRGSRAKMLQ